MRTAAARFSRQKRQMRNVGRIFLPEHLAQRLNGTMRRLGSDFPLAYCVRYAFRLANASPEASRSIEGPFAYQLTTVSCEARLLAETKRSAVRVFGQTRGAYSCYVRSAIDIFVRFAESKQVEVLSGSNGSLSAATLPQFWVSESMFAGIRTYLAENPDQNYGRFVRQASRYALRHPARLPRTVEGPFVRLCHAATADPDLSLAVRTRCGPNPQEFMRGATGLWLKVVTPSPALGIISENGFPRA